MTKINKVVAIVTRRPVVVRLRDMLIYLRAISMSSIFFLFRFVTFVDDSAPFVGKRVIQNRYSNNALYQGPSETMIAAVPVNVWVRKVRFSKMFFQFCCGLASWFFIAK